MKRNRTAKRRFAVRVILPCVGVITVLSLGSIFIGLNLKGSGGGLLKRHPAVRDSRSKILLPKKPSDLAAFVKDHESSRDKQVQDYVGAARLRMGYAYAADHRWERPVRPSKRHRQAIGEPASRVRTTVEFLTREFTKPTCVWSARVRSPRRPSLFATLSNHIRIARSLWLAIDASSG